MHWISMILMISDTLSFAEETVQTHEEKEMINANTSKVIKK